MKNHVFKKMIATVLAVATVITAVPLSAVTANAASSDLVTVKSVKQSTDALKKMAYFYGGDASDYKTTCKKTGKDQYTVTTTNQDFRFYTGKDNCFSTGDLKITLNTSKLKQKIKKTKNYTYKTSYTLKVLDGDFPIDEIDNGKKKTASFTVGFNDFANSVNAKDRYTDECYNKGSFSVSYSLNDYLPIKYKGKTLKVEIYKITDKIPKGYKWSVDQTGTAKPVRTVKIKFDIKNPTLIAEQEYQKCLDWMNAQSYDSEYADIQRIDRIESVSKTWFYGARYGDGFGYHGYEEILRKNIWTPNGDYYKVWHCGVCEEHARLFVEFAQDMGYECQLVTDHEQDHAFAIITMNGKRYFVETMNGGTVTTPISTQNINKLEGETIIDMDDYIGNPYSVKYVKNGRNIFTGEIWDYDPEIEEYTCIEGTSNLNPFPYNEYFKE